MKKYLLRSNNITKSYGKHNVLNGISLNIEEGDIYGFIGKNGAGKTTMIRIILGLVNYDNGSLELFSNKDIDSSRAQIGSLIESPKFYSNMTAEENLKLIAIQRNIEKTADIAKVLKLVNLNNTNSKKSKDFSLGMKQRLGIAMAILSNPKLLILDEPINGLDPIGIKEIRELLINLNRELGTTILISSHILSELTQMATKYGFINKGHLIKEITDEDLHNELENCLEIEVSSTKNIEHIFNLLNIHNYNINKNTIKIYDKVQLENFSIILANHNISLYKLVQKEESLEEFFNKLIEGDTHE